MPLLGSRGAASTTGFGALANLGYFLRNSLRFRSSAVSYLNRTPASASNRRIWTWSGWVKRGALGGTQCIFCSGSTTTGQLSTQFYFGSDGLALYSVTAGGGNDIYLLSNAVYRDPAAWYHLVLAVDTTQATSSNRAKIYVNGTEVTSFSSSTYPTQNYETAVNNTVVHNLANVFNLNAGVTLDGYMAEVNFVDGQQLTPSSFGKIDAATNQWIPKKYSGAYGTNGFYLKFSDTSSTSTLVADSSGNGNNWTPNNISLTSGITYDSMTDVPTNTNSTTANYPTLNPLDMQVPSEPLSGGNLNVNGGNNVRATMACPATGKYYFEYTRTNTTDAAHVGVFSTTAPITSLTSGSILYKNDGNVFVNDSVVATYASYTTNDVIGVGMDMDTGNIYFSKNNVFQGSVGLASAGITVGNVIPAVRNNTGATASVNFGQRPFVYPSTSGFKALNTFNLP